MTEDSGKLGSEQTRPALGNLTNLPAKRGISSILGDLIDESGKIVAHEGSRGKFSKRLCLVVDDLVKETARPADTNEGSTLNDKKNSSGDSDDKKESEEYHDAIMFSSGDGKALNESESVQISFEPGDRAGARELNVSGNVSHTDVPGEGLALSMLTGNTERQNPREDLPNCLDLRSFEMNRCSNVKGKEHVDQNMGDDLLNSCSCSFCLKAAYIWSDLHYQDIKGQLSALKKSQEKASNLIQRNGQEWPTNLHASGSGEQECKLTGQWRSLFLSMGDILGHESNHLQNSLETMRKLREDCKLDLERATKTPHSSPNK